MTKRQRCERVLASTLMTMAMLTAANAGDDDDRRRPDRPQLHNAFNDSGVAVTISTNGFIDRRNPFFRELGTNERSCVTCHQPTEGWTITPKGLAERFRQTRGTDPVFRTNDGANSPQADVSTPRAREKSYSMLLAKGVIRVGLPIPAGAEFELAAVDDPYRYASAAELSLFRRPLASTNLRFLSTVMWAAARRCAMRRRPIASSTLRPASRRCTSTWRRNPTTRRSAMRKARCPSLPTSATRSSTSSSACTPRSSRTTTPAA